MSPSPELAGLTLPPGYMVRRLDPGELEPAPVLTALAFDAKRSWAYPEPWIQAWTDSLTITPKILAESRVWVVFYRPPAGPDARRDWVPVGFTVLQTDGSVAGIEHFWIDPGHQGRRLGRALFAALLQDARTGGAEVLEVVSDPNAEGFYRRLGFRPHSRLRADVLGRERYLPILRRPLTPLT